MKLKIISAVNAGIICEIGGQSIWCDVLHDTRVEGFSTLTEDRYELLINRNGFMPPSLLFYTHCRHFDHYSQGMNEQFLKNFPYTLAVAPRRLRDTDIFISGESQRLRFKDVSLEFIRLTHEGKQFKEVPHYGCMLSHAGQRILIVGDCSLCSEELKKYIEDKTIDVLVAPFPWITLQKGMDFINKYIRPKHIIVNHLPLKEDDIYGYNKAAVKSAGRIIGPKVHVFTKMLQEVAIEYG